MPEINLGDTQLGTKIHNAYRNAKRVGCVEDWQDYQVFAAWSLNNGASVDRKMFRRDLTKPYGPDNCTWADKIVRLSEDGLHQFSPENWDKICEHLKEGLKCD